MNEEKYDIAVSYASEQRLYVQRFVRHLQRMKLQVYYDQNEQTRMVGKILDQELHKIYIHQSSHCVLFLSNEYVNKPVTRYESQIILSETLFKDGFMYVFKFDDVTLPSLNRNFIYSTVEEFPEPEKYADFMYEVTQSRKPEYKCEESLREVLSNRLKKILERLAYQYGLELHVDQQANKTLLQIQSGNSVFLQFQAGNIPGKSGVCLWLHRGHRACDKHTHQGYVQWCAKRHHYLLENQGVLTDLTPKLIFSTLDELVNRLEAEVRWLMGE